MKEVDKARKGLEKHTEEISFQGGERDKVRRRIVKD